MNERLEGFPPFLPFLSFHFFFYPWQDVYKNLMGDVVKQPCCRSYCFAFSTHNFFLLHKES